MPWTETSAARGNGPLWVNVYLQATGCIIPYRGPVDSADGPVMTETLES
jgi:hypothetical protein